MSLFEPPPVPGSNRESGVAAPLADRIRPETLEAFVGQLHILGPGKPLRKQIERDELHSMILWGPPGSGKTTLAVIIARRTKSDFVRFSAVLAGIKEIKDVMAAAEKARQYGRRTILFVDEIHRFNRAQQDAFLPAVESGTLSLLGATTENPSFEVNSALLSRCRVFVLKQLAPQEIELILDRALSDAERGVGGRGVVLLPEARAALGNLAGGDARSALNALELASLTAPANERGQRIIGAELAREALQRNTILYDQSGEEHYNLISALHKSIRHSDPDAALYYLARMVAGGEDPLFIARRLVRAASEDIGLADPQAVVQALAAKQAVEFIGYPECDTALAQATVYLACAPKSNAIYMAAKAARAEVDATGPVPVPLHFRNAPTALMKALDYGEGYQYDHDWPEKISPQEAMPEELRERKFYHPGTLGFEKEIVKRLEYFERIKQKLRQEASNRGDPSAAEAQPKS
jgi:putative ATPase